MENKRVLYSGVVLDQESREFLVDRFSGLISGSNWEFIAHHMTINLGPLQDKSQIGKTVKLTATGFGTSDKAIAIKVEGYPSKNKIPHVTIAINKALNGKPVDSNSIKNWHEYNSPYELTGVVTEITAS